MRMWMTNPAIMCRKHLLGEHVELHMFVGSINKGTRMGRYVTEGLLEFDSLRSRHTALVTEMKRRGYQHKSPLPRCRAIPKAERVRINTTQSLAELLGRCAECRKLGMVKLQAA